MKFLALLIAGAVSPFLLSFCLPPALTLWLLLLTVALLLLNPHHRIAAMFPLAFLFTSLAIDHRLTGRLPEPANQTVYQLNGRIGNLPQTDNDSLRFEFFPENAPDIVPDKILVHWYDRSRQATTQTINLPHAGERWQLQLELRTTRRRINFTGVDAERWLFANNIGALGYVQPGDNIIIAAASMFDFQGWRSAVYGHLNHAAAGAPAFRLLVALAIADRRALTPADRSLLSATGTGHLLAISGLHIGLAAVMGFYFGRILLLTFPYVIRLNLAILLPWCMAWLAALSYSALAGFGVSTQRALIMLSVATLVVLSRRKVHPGLAWMMAMSLVLLIDPFAPLRAGFWFSFIAVATLLVLFVPRAGKARGWQTILTAQLGISLIMAPLSMYWFQQASLPGLIANLIAIPVISFLVVPLILVSMCVLALPWPLATGLLNVAGYITEGLMTFLDRVSTLQPDWMSQAQSPGFITIILAMLGALIILLPRGAPVRWSGLALMVPLLLPLPTRLSPSETQTDFLDVGQGLAVLVSSESYLLLYDTGPGNGLSGEEQWNMVDGTIKPMILASGLQPNLIVVSHADLDHAGGLTQLRASYPQSEIMASLPVLQKGIHRCTSPSNWLEGGLSFNVLHPSSGLPYLGNDSSCVISMNGKGLNMLLSGDISKRVENGWQIRA